MRLSTAAAVIGVFLPSVSAIFADEAWDVDYHYALLGEPNEQTTFFHQPNPGSRASLIYTLSEQGVLGAVNPKDGALVWRQELDLNATSSTPKFLRAGEDQDVVVSGIGHQAAAWSAADGRQVWSLNFRGTVEDVEVLEMGSGTATPSSKDVIVMSSGEAQAVIRVDGLSGSVKWEYKIDGADTPYQVSMSTTDVFAIVLHKTLLGNIKLKVITLDLITGRKTDEYSLSSDSEVSSSKSILAVGANSASPIIAWTDASHSVLKVNIIGTKSVSSFNLEKNGDASLERIRVHAPIRANVDAHFLVQHETASSHWADVFHIDLRRNKIEKAYSLPKTTGRGAFSTSTDGANVYFTHITQDKVEVISSASAKVLATWAIDSFGVVAGEGEAVEPIHAVTEASIKSNTVSAVRTAILTSVGEWVLLRDGVFQWHRPEELAGTLSAAFAEPAAVQTLAQNLAVEAHSDFVTAYIHRLKRHLKDLQAVPALLSALPQQALSGLLGTTAESGHGGDIFGFHQVVACVTRNGRLVALDAGNPYKILWSERIAHYWDGALSKPSIRSSKPGILAVDSGLPRVTVKFNSTTGEQIFQTLDVTEEIAARHQAIRYSLVDGSLHATIATSPVWHFNPGPGNHIQSIIPRPVHDPVASIGKVLGDRRVLYKYLSPNVALVVATNVERQSVTVSVLDTVSGAVLFSNTHHGVDLTAAIPTIMSENWFAYSYTSLARDDTPRGHQLVAGEMFESLVPNDRGPLSSASNVSSMHSAAEPFTLAQTYQISESIARLAVTRTQQGITTRQLLAVLPESHSVIGIPYAAIDPRRPVNRDPTKDEQMEGLSRYGPVIEFDPQWSLSHRRDVFGIKDLITSPATIESTSLVFGYGLDVFGTRLSPSFSFDILGKDFNKLQMLATVLALAVVTLLVAPLVMRKQVNARWQFA